jgi:hypothetical protein
MAEKNKAKNHKKSFLVEGQEKLENKECIGTP